MGAERPSPTRGALKTGGGCRGPSPTRVAVARTRGRVNRPIFFNFFLNFLDKSRNLSKIVSVLLSASVERFFVSRVRDFFYLLEIYQET